jgi:hypothetical protein
LVRLPCGGGFFARQLFRGVIGAPTIKKSSQEIGLHAAPSHVGAHGGFQLSLQLLSGDCMQCAANARQCLMYWRCLAVVLGSKVNSPCIALSLARPSVWILSLPQNGAYQVVGPLAPWTQSQPNIPAAAHIVDMA